VSTFFEHEQQQQQQQQPLFFLRSLANNSKAEKTWF